MRPLIALVLGLLPCWAMAAQSFDIAHVRQQGVDMVIIPVGPSFYSRDSKAQAQLYTAMQVCVRSAHLKGEVALVSSNGSRFLFYGPPNWQPFFQYLDMNWVWARINGHLTCQF